MSLVKKLTMLTLAMTFGLAAVLTPATAQASGIVQRGCPAEAFCMYPRNAYWNNNHPSHIYSKRPDLDKHYVVNMRNLIGTHKVFNNMSCAYVSLNLGYNGAQPTKYIRQGQSFDLDLTRYNSFTVCGTMCQ